MAPNRPNHRKAYLSYSALLVLGTILAPLAGLIGCGSAQRDSRYDLSGKITYGGEPIPRGYLLFAPDTEKGNSGPGSSASIIDGHYQTVSGQGTVGGPYVVTIAGTDGIPIDLGEGIPPNLAGNPIFPKYETHVDLPKQTDTHDFDVPVSHGKDKSTAIEQKNG